MDKSVGEASGPTLKDCECWSESGVKREQEGTRASECPRMTQGDARVRVVAHVHRTELSGRLPGYANSNARLRWRERTLLPSPATYVRINRRTGI